jgi:hypothetical protein
MLRAAEQHVARNSALHSCAKPAIRAEEGDAHALLAARFHQLRRKTDAAEADDGPQKMQRRAPKGCSFVIDDHRGPLLARPSAFSRNIKGVQQFFHSGAPLASICARSHRGTGLGLSSALGRQASFSEHCSHFSG